MVSSEFEDRRILWEQFCEVHAEQQQSYDGSIRTLAAAGVAVTASLGTALDGLAGWGVAAIILFLTSLGLNLISYVTAQRDMKVRLESLAEHGLTDAVEGNIWTTWTTALNLGAGAALVVGGVCLAVFV
jgi:hypothetical protein